MRSLFAKRDVASETRDQYGRWTVGQGNSNSAKAYAHFKVHERATAARLAGEARQFAGKRGELLRRKVFEANAREFKRQGGDKVRSQTKRLEMLLRLHGQHMLLPEPDQINTRTGETQRGELPMVNAAILAHALQHNEGPLGRLTPSYRDMIRRKVKAGLAAEGEKMKAAMEAKKPRKPRAAKAAVTKFNQEHDDRGEFTGPGGSHDPTGNPRGRPSTGAGPTNGQRVGQAALDVGASALGGYAGATLFGAAGAAVGGVPGAVIGSAAGKWAGSILGSLAGDYVASKIGQSLLGIKEQADGHAVGTGTIIGGIAGGVAPLAAGALLPGGSAVGRLFSLSNFSLGAHLAQDTAVDVGSAVGHQFDQGAGQTAGRAVTKSMFDKPPKSYDGTFGSMADPALPHIFGPRAWKAIANKPFGAYVRQKVKDAADKMDDAAEAQGMDLKPAKPAQVSVANTVMQQAEAERQAQEQQAMMAQQAQAQQAPGASKPPGGAPGAMQKSLFRKAAVIPARSPNDVVYRDAQQTGGAANLRFLQRMQESDRKSRQAQMVRLMAQPRVENLARQPSEDERAYQDRVQQVAAQSLRSADRVRATLFAGGEAGKRPVYQVRKKHSVATHTPAASNDDDQSWTIEAEFAKEWNTDDKLDQGLVYGWASIIEKNGQIVTDHQGDRITSDELVKAAHNYITNSRKGGVLHDEYGNHIGHIVESLVFTKELQDRLGIDLKKVGWLIGYQIVDPRAKMLAKARLLKSFSIGGRGKRIPVPDHEAA